VESRIRDILLTDWDPTGAARSEFARHEYDAYLAPLHDLIQSGADMEAIVDYLYAVERDICCFPALGKQRLHRVARKLLTLNPRALPSPTTPSPL
jgi:hypothetical protein